jgi:plasmid maintenance system antidote protein VapI
MLKGIFHLAKKTANNKLPSGREEYRSFFIKKSAWEAIRALKGWHKRGSISRFAEELGITRQYASLIVGGKAGCSSFVMRKIKRLVGINGSCWCHLFEETRVDDVDLDHPIYNQAKYNGEVPYQRYSSSAELRDKDYKTEIRKKSLTKREL